MNPYVVYRTSDNHFGYRSIRDARGGQMICSGMVARGEACQTWMIEAKSGNDAIARIKKIMKAQAIK